jgi:hypothetical protein
MPIARARHTLTTRAAACALFLASTVLLTGCGSDAAPSTPTSPVTETYSGAFQPGGATSRSFIAAKNGDVTLLLISTTPVDVIFELGFGTADADGRNCKITETVLTGSNATTPQITKTVATGTYCLRVRDPGNLVANGSFVVTIVRP